MPVVAATELGAFFLIQFWTEYFGTHLPVRRIDPLALVTRTVLKNLNSRLFFLSVLQFLKKLLGEAKIAERSFASKSKIEISTGSFAHPL